MVETQPLERLQNLKVLKMELLTNRPCDLAAMDQKKLLTADNLRFLCERGQGRNVKYFLVNASWSQRELMHCLGLSSFTGNTRLFLSLYDACKSYIKHTPVWYTKALDHAKANKWTEMQTAIRKCHRGPDFISLVADCNEILRLYT